MDRWEGIERPYTQHDVERLRGSVASSTRWRGWAPSASGSF